MIWQGRWNLEVHCMPCTWQHLWTTCFEVFRLAQHGNPIKKWCRSRVLMTWWSRKVSCASSTIFQLKYTRIQWSRQWLTQFYGIFYYHFWRINFPLTDDVISWYPCGKLYTLYQLLRPCTGIYLIAKVHLHWTKANIFYPTNEPHWIS